jgi:hypothetical protein
LGGQVSLQEVNDLLLLLFGCDGAAAAAAGVLGREQHWRRAALVRALGIRAAGLTDQACYQVSTLTSPTRIVVDIQAP